MKYFLMKIVVAIDSFFLRDYHNILCGFTETILLLEKKQRKVA